MAFISFDVGVKNLAICEAEAQGKVVQKIRKWELYDIAGENLEATVRNVSALLSDKYDVIDAHATVLVERQIMYNVKAFVLSYVIMSYFLAMGIKVEMCGATIKPVQEKGKKRKRDANAIATKLLDDAGFSSWSEFLAAQRKRDDLADAYLQIVGYVKKHGRA